MCSGCSPGKCEIPVSEALPMQIACPTCDGIGCDVCGVEGWVKITECPRKIVDRDTMNFIELADFAKDGAFPVAGGTLDQSQSFLVACRYLFNEDAKAESQKYKEK